MTVYRERLWASPWLYVATALIIPATLLVAIPINPIAGIVIAVVLYGACVALLIGTSPTITVTEDSLVAGRARIDRRFLGMAEHFAKEEATRQRGVDLDARAWLLIRGWVDPVVRIPINDPQDPAPYWLVSTRRPKELTRVLNDRGE